MNNAQNAITALNTALQATSSNIANMNVTGYKRVDVSFQSVFERVLNNGTPARESMGGTNPFQLGSSMSVSSVGLDMTQATPIDGAPMDLAINGQGFFIISPDGGTTYRYTRAGNFKIDANGNLTSNNMVVYGFNASGNVAPITGLTYGAQANYSWAQDGTLLYNGTGTGFRIALTYFTNPSGLAQAQGTSYAATMASGDAASAVLADGAAGSLYTAQLEPSNVFYLGETLDALEIQRAMNANLSMIQLASDMISSFISKLSS